MGLFSRRSKVATCDVCGKSEMDGCGGVGDHVVEIRDDQPTWLPAGWRAQAQGEYTFLCSRCDSYPASKWPSSGGALSGLTIHLGQAHHVGMMANVGGALPRDEMIRAR